MIHENTAAALYYGLDRSDESLHTVIFYNLGSSSLKVTLAEYSRISEANKKPIEQIQIVANSINYEVGSQAIDLVLVDYFAEEFDSKRLGK
jgi:hypoxia up-regulated 1